MRTARRVSLACGLLAASGAIAQPVGPVETAVRFYEAAQASRCGEVWALYSKATQEHIRLEVHRSERERDGAPQKEAPEEKYCRVEGQFKRGSARLARSQGDEAVVAADFDVKRVGNRYGIVIRPTRESREIRLVREAGAWKVDRPRPKVQPTLVTLVEVGAVDVRLDPVIRGLHQRLEATAVSRAPREALDGVLRDPRGWASVLPSFKAIEPMERAGELDRVLLAFAEPSRPIPVTVRLSGKPVDPKTGWTSLQWNVENDSKAPIYMRGAWTLTPNSDGTTRVKLMLVIDPRHWPGSEGLFSAERLANAVLDLEKAAGK